VTCSLTDGTTASADVPSGASTGAAEAWELRDGGTRFRGLGVRLAAGHVEGEILSALRGIEMHDQRDLDERLLALDGTPNKSRLGANALLGVSLAFARACAASMRRPLYQALEELDQGASGPPSLPRPMINLFSGGRHAGGQVAIQDVLVIPLAPTAMSDVLAMTAEIYQCAAELCTRYFGTRLLRADEGGQAPPVANSEALLALAAEAIGLAGLSLGTDVGLAVDAAASHFFRDETYVLDGEVLSRDGMLSRLLRWIDDYGLLSVEDGLAEEDWTGWQALAGRTGDRVLVVGDDFLCTNPSRIKRAVALGAATALLLKVNQIGTLSEAAHASKLARQAGWRVIVSARSGETEDNWLADLAVAWKAGHIKIGSITQSERLSKYNRLLEIERLTGWPVRPMR
jgi:enolase